MGRKYLVFVLLLSLSLLTSGCYDSRELDDMTFVTMLGLDKGTKQLVNLSVQFERISGSRESKNQASNKKSSDIEVISGEADTIFTGEGVLNIATSRQLDNSHIKVIVVSEEMAKSPLMEKYISAIVRHPKIRRIMHIIIVRGKAEDFLRQNELMTNASTAKALEIMMTQSEYTAYFPHANVDDFYRGLKSSKRQAIAPLGGVNMGCEEENEQQGQAGGKGQSENKPVMAVETNKENVLGHDAAYKAGELPRSGGLAREIFGTALFDGARMVGTLNGEETRLLIMVRDEFKKSDFVIKDPLAQGYVVPLQVRRSRAPEIKVDTSAPQPVIHIKLILEGNINAIQSRINYERPEEKKILEEAFEVEIKRQLDAVIEKCRREYKVDCFAFGRTAVRNFMTIEEWEDYNWLAVFANAQVDTEVEFNIRRTGIMIKSAPLRYAEEGIK